MRGRVAPASEGGKEWHDVCVRIVGASVRALDDLYHPARRCDRHLGPGARRGVDVRLVLPRASDLAVITRAARGEYARWLRRGLRIAAHGRTVLHAKIAVVDDDWCTVGTFNVNATSVACVHEMNVVVEEHGVVADVAGQIERGLANSYEVTLDLVRSWRLARRALHLLTACVMRALE